MFYIQQLIIKIFYQFISNRRLVKMDSYVCYMDYYVPKQQIDVEDVFNNLSEEKKNSLTSVDVYDEYIKRFKKETRLSKISYFKNFEEFSCKVFEMVDRMLKATNIDVNKIDYIMCGHEHLLNANNISIVHSLQSEFGLTNSMILPIMHPCAATLCGLKLSDKLLDKDRYILIISGCFWKEVDERFIGFSMRGDGIGLTLISSYGEFKICGNYSLNYNNAIYDIHGKERYDSSLSRLNLIKKGSEFLMDSMKQYNRLGVISKIIQPNAGYSVFYDLYSHYAKVDPSLFYYENISDGGHMCDIDIVRNLKDFIDDHGVNKGDYIMLYTPDVQQSFDINYYSSLLQKCDV